MIDENNGCITKSKLTITVKTLTKYNDPSRVAANSFLTTPLYMSDYDFHYYHFVTEKPLRKSTLSASLLRSLFSHCIIT